MNEIHQELLVFNFPQVLFTSLVVLASSYSFKVNFNTFNTSNYITMFMGLAMTDAKIENMLYDGEFGIEL